MIISKTAPVFLLALLVGADKKIELTDIEEDNLKSEKEKDNDNEPRGQINSHTGLLPLEFLKNGFFRYFEAPSPQQPRYVQQYAVTEPPEQAQVQPVAPKPQYGIPEMQQAMIGYYSNVPMQIYLVPQYYNEGEQPSPQPTAQYAQTAPSGPSGRGYPTAPEVKQPQTNYVEVPTYVTPSGKGYVQNYPQKQEQQYQQAVAYVTYSPQPSAPQATAPGPMLYQMPLIQYQTALAAPPVAPKGYYPQQSYTETNSVDDSQDVVENPKHYAVQTEVPYQKPTAPDYPRLYHSRHPVREDPRLSPISELPPPNPLLLKSLPPHLSHLPKALPMYRPLLKPGYGATAGGFTPYMPRPHEAYGKPFRRKPTSLLDSYIPSSLQIEYLKRGQIKDPLQAYEALSTGRHFHAAPRHFERGFLPNQMFHTAAGGVTFGHQKRTTNLEKVPKK